MLNIDRSYVLGDEGFFWIKVLFLSYSMLLFFQARYVCAVTNDVLGNSVPCVLLRTS